MLREEDPNKAGEREQIEIALLLEGLFQLYGYDFRNYAFSSIRRRIWHRVNAERLPTITALTERVLHDRAVMNRLLTDLTIHVTEMFRDPEAFRAFRQSVVPLLRTYPFIRIWHAGCSTGEEVYSMAILLKEEGLYDKTRIYATDMNERVLETAREGVFPLERMQTFTRNYIEAGGKESFSNYYTAKYDSVLFKSELKSNIVFAQHNLVTDRSFNEFNVIFCRNVMIYFNKELQNHVHGLLFESLSTFGILALGTKESINFTRHADAYEELDAHSRLYRKIKS
ncbi:protein-glutamate O-methyltransferase CheR [Paenibacillus sp. MWE-103]|uniref:Protein-glutamate O-methyltransferase CheR n=1 Tax=Paenibacillus artemisiicola TaxID=1172618 RepID=A0ABS3W9M8_9BACL|nr:protein-glutamate O-methyltransferase CheR [Paenibacillus artemisiicola]MBO7745027.1 protein-glutamate O-methyltransferase CheR [Paenibacillus artemisiicola]